MQFFHCIAHIISLFAVLSSARPGNRDSARSDRSSHYRRGDRHSHRFAWNEAQSLIAFGDSYTYVQGTPLGLTNFSFVGERDRLAFTGDELLNNSILQYGPSASGSTSAGGPNWVEYLTNCGLRNGTTKPRDCRLQLWDFAFAGADIADEFLPPHHNYTTSLELQVSQFKQYGDPVLSSFLDKKKALVASWIGINDVSDGASRNLSTPQFYAQLQAKHFELMEEVYQLGYENFLFVNLPPLNRRPGYVNSPNPATNATMVSWYNDALSTAAHAFSQNRPGAFVEVFDAHRVLSSILDDPETWGFKNTTGTCAGYNQPDIKFNPEKYGCLPLNEYFWYDTGHITWRVHEILAGFLREFLDEKSH